MGMAHDGTCNGTERVLRAPLALGIFHWQNQMTVEQQEFIRMVRIGLDNDYIWSDFVMGWHEADWLEQSNEVREQVTSWVKEYREGEYDARRHGQSKEIVNLYKKQLRDILGVLVEGKPLRRSAVDDEDIPF
jgi:hypothetical protein